MPDKGNCSPVLSSSAQLLVDIPVLLCSLCKFLMIHNPSNLEALSELKFYLVSELIPSVGRATLSVIPRELAEVAFVHTLSKRLTKATGSFVQLDRYDEGRTSACLHHLDIIAMSPLYIAGSPFPRFMFAMDMITRRCSFSDI